MNKLAFLFFCFFSIYSGQVTLAGSIARNTHDPQTTLDPACTKNSHSYSLNELLKNIQPVYHSSVIEATAKIALNENKSTIVFTPLLGGLSKAQLFQVSVNNRKYVLRLLDEKKAIERRKSEVFGHLLGDSLKIAPKLIYTDQIPLVMVMEFIEGRTLSSADLNDHDLIKKVMQTLKKIHYSDSTNSLLKRTKMEAINDIYERNLKKGIVYPSCFMDLYNKLQKDFDQLEATRLPCHGDMNMGNIILTEDGQVYLIDWAEATIDNPLLDIGWFSCFSGANLAQIHNILHAYYGRRPTANELHEALFFKNLTTFLVATLWIGRQEERDQKTLDALLNGPLKRSSEYIEEGITTLEISKKTGLEKTKYALGWLKEYICAISLQEADIHHMNQTVLESSN